MHITITVTEDEIRQILIASMIPEDHPRFEVMVQHAMANLELSMKEHMIEDVRYWAAQLD